MTDTLEGLQPEGETISETDVLETLPEGEEQSEGAEELTQGLPDDPKLLRAAFTKKSQELAELRRRAEELESKSSLTAEEKKKLNDLERAKEWLWQDPGFKDYYERRVKAEETGVPVREVKKVAMPDTFETKEQFMNWMDEYLDSKINNRVAPLEMRVGSSARETASLKLKDAMYEAGRKYKDQGWNKEIARSCLDLLEEGRVKNIDDAFAIVSSNQKYKQTEEHVKNTLKKKTAPILQPSTHRTTTKQGGSDWDEIRKELWEQS